MGQTPSATILEEAGSTQNPYTACFSVALGFVHSSLPATEFDRLIDVLRWVIFAHAASGCAARPSDGLRYNGGGTAVAGSRGNALKRLFLCLFGLYNWLSRWLFGMPR